MLAICNRLPVSSLQKAAQFRVHLRLIQTKQARLVSRCETDSADTLVCRMSECLSALQLVPVYRYVCACVLGLIEFQLPSPYVVACWTGFWVPHCPSYENGGSMPMGFEDCGTFAPAWGCWAQKQAQLCAGEWLGSPALSPVCVPLC